MYVNLDSDSDELDVIIEDSDEEDEIILATPSAASNIFGLVVAFLLNFKVIYNVSDQALVLLLRFFKYIIFLIGTAFNIPQLKDAVYPQSIRGCYSYINLDPHIYREYIVCPGCHMLYDHTVTSLTSGTSINPQSTKCSFIEFPNHPQERFRQPCNTILLQKVQRKN